MHAKQGVENTGIIMYCLYRSKVPHDIQIYLQIYK